MKPFLLVLLAALVCPNPGRAMDPAARSDTPTVKAAGLMVRVDDLILSDKKAYAHMLWDAYPLRDTITAMAKARGMEPAAFRRLAVKDLVAGPLKAKAPKAPKVKVDVVEFDQRDEYGMPQMASIKKLDHIEMDAPFASTKTAAP